MRRTPRWLVGLVGLSTGCHPPPAETVTEDAPWTRDLVAEYHQSTTTPGHSELDFGTEEVRALLLAGWGSDETSPEVPTFVWATDSTSVMRLPMSLSTSLEATFTAHAHWYPGAPRQAVEVWVNGALVDEFTVGREWETGSFTIPEGFLRAGGNLVEFRYAFAEAPSSHGGSDDHRRLAVAWDQLELSLSAGHDDDAGTLFVPFGGEVRYHLRLPPGARLEWDGSDAGRGESLRVTVLSPADGTESEWTMRTPVDTVELASDQTQGVVRLSLAAQPTEGSGAPWGLTVRRPRVVSDDSASSGSARLVRPNILVYLVDSLRADHLGCYGYPRPTSPRIDDFAGEGVLFEQAIAESSWSRASAASLLTGLYPPAHATVGRRDHLPPTVRTLAEMLRDGGYATAAFSTNGNVSAEFGFDRGFETFVYLGESASGPVHQSAAEVNQQVLDWLDGFAGDRPFFHYVHVSDPHGPYTPPARFRAELAPEAPGGDFATIEWMGRLHDREVEVNPGVVLSLVDLYDAEIAYTDAQFGRLEDELRRRGLWEDTLVVLTADQGQEFFEHGGWEHGGTLYAEILEVPLIVKYPAAGSMTPGRSGNLVQLTDIATTALSAAGLQAPERLTGLDLTDPTVVHQPQERHGFSHMGLTTSGEALTTSSWKYLRLRPQDGPASRQLYDRVHDRAEITDVLADHLAVAGELDRILQAHLDAQVIDDP